jgi:hypothetical protein
MFEARCPVAPREQRWIEESIGLFRREFATGRPVVLPTDLPGPHTDIHDVFHQVCRHAEVDPRLITVELYGGEAEFARAAGLTLRSTSAAGDYRREAGRAIIGLDVAALSHPAHLIATIAHELAHHRLDERGLDRPDHEPLADLLTVHMGLGIFTANAAFEYRVDGRRRSTHRLGYLTEPMFGYGLACHAWLREEAAPAWARHVDGNPRSTLRRGLRYLARHTTPGHLPAD